MTAFMSRHAKRVVTIPASAVLYWKENNHITFTDENKKQGIRISGILTTHSVKMATILDGINFNRKKIYSR